MAHDDRYYQEAARRILMERLEQQSPDSITLLALGLPVVLYSRSKEGQVGGPSITIFPEDLWTNVFYSFLYEYLQGKVSKDIFAPRPASSITTETKFTLLNHWGFSTLSPETLAADPTRYDLLIDLYLKWRAQLLKENCDQVRYVIQTGIPLGGSLELENAHNAFRNALKKALKEAGCYRGSWLERILNKIGSRLSK